MSADSIIDSQALRALFKHECSQRLQAFSLALAATVQTMDDPDVWDKLHQELDSLANGARTVNDAETELLGRRLATMARMARDHAALRNPALDILFRAVTAIQCHCLEKEGDACLLSAHSYENLLKKVDRLEFKP
uniref:HPt domain-containing protein n=1 Tax=Magnetococcus massalia (strain MO-1) TaxID=451514 RepID=A0A1S7LGJ0_MAGMO|nr:Conserved protein of unknown function [Candidatus Magnetococcus massalia]